MDLDCDVATSRTGSVSAEDCKSKCLQIKESCSDKSKDFLSCLATHRGLTGFDKDCVTQDRRLAGKGIIFCKRVPKDCKYSEWSEWSSCSATCRSGPGSLSDSVRIRSRKVVQPNSAGGQPCRLGKGMPLTQSLLRIRMQHECCVVIFAQPPIDCSPRLCVLCVVREGRDEPGGTVEAEVCSFQDFCGEFWRCSASNSLIELSCPVLSYASWYRAEDPLQLSFAPSSAVDATLRSYKLPYEDFADDIEEAVVLPVTPKPEPFLESWSSNSTTTTHSPTTIQHNQVACRIVDMSADKMEMGYDKEVRTIDGLMTYLHTYSAASNISQPKRSSASARFE